MKLVEKEKVENAICTKVDKLYISNNYKVVEDMKKLMVEKNGIGLASPQIGINVQMFIMKYGNEIITCYNPSWKMKGEKKVVSVEGCLTYEKGRQARVKRSKMIVASYTNEDGEEVTIKMRGTDSIVFQHESDHLIGKTIFKSGGVN